MLILVALLIKVYNAPDQSGGALKQVTIANKYTEPYYSRQYRELDDVNNVLNRPTFKPVDYINKLQPANEACASPGQKDDTLKCSRPLELKVPHKRYLHFTDIETKQTPQNLKVLVESKQPYFLDEALVVDYYGKKFYWDSRYPKEPISVLFAQDPERFIREHPNEYPSYIIKSRDYSRLKPAGAYSYAE